MKFAMKAWRIARFLSSEMGLEKTRNSERGMRKKERGEKGDRPAGQASHRERGIFNPQITQMGKIGREGFEL